MPITRHPSVNTQHSYTETPYNPTTIFDVLGVDLFSDPDSLSVLNIDLRESA